MKDNISDNPLAALEEIKKVMQSSTRIFSLSGWSGVWAGGVALISTLVFFYIKVVLASTTMRHVSIMDLDDYWHLVWDDVGFALQTNQKEYLLWSAFLAVILAIAGAVFFSIRKYRRVGQRVSYNEVARKLLINLAIPMCVGAIFCLHFLYADLAQYLVPCSLTFYGLALINSSKYTYQDIKYLGLIQIALGLLALFVMQYHLWFWALGFGVMHIVYGVSMWLKYDTK